MSDYDGYVFAIIQELHIWSGNCYTKESATKIVGRQ
jgi:hypothetical protein